MRVLDSKEDGELVAGAPTPDEFVSAEAVEHHQQVIEASMPPGSSTGPPPTWSEGSTTTRERRSSTWPRATRRRRHRWAVAGGTTDLPRSSGGRSTPSVGLAMGIDRIVLALAGTEEPLPLDLFIVLADPALQPEAVGLVGRLRRAGCRRLRPEPGSVRRSSVRRGKARHAAVVGEEGRPARWWCAISAPVSNS